MQARKRPVRPAFFIAGFLPLFGEIVMNAANGANFQKNAIIYHQKRQCFLIVIQSCNKSCNSSKFWAIISPSS
jgi:hypothetical protein